MRADKQGSPDLSSYPQGEGFKDLTGWTEAGGHEGPKVNILAITAFFGGSNVADLYSVSEKGSETDVRAVWNFALEASHFKQLSPDQISDLRRSIAALPDTNSLPPVENLVVVGFQSDGKWQVRAFDNRNLPPAMQRIYGIIGERFETVQQRTGHP